MVEILETLKNVTALSQLAPATLQALTQCAQLISFESGYQFYRQGTSPSGLFYLRCGQVKLYRHSQERMQILQIIQAGALFGAETLPNQVPCPCTAAAITDGTVIYIPPEELLNLMPQHPDVTLLLLAIISKELRQFTQIVHSLAFRDVSARLAETLLTMAVYDNSDSVYVQRTLSQQDLAALVGTAREVIYRTLKKFEKNGLIQLRPQTIVLCNVAQLQAIATQEMR